MTSKKKQLLIAVAIAVIAILCTQWYISNRVEEYKPKKYVTLARAKEAVRAGYTLRRKSVEKTKVPAKYVPRVAIRWSDLENFMGQELAVDVPSGDYILENYFTVRRAVGNKLSDQIEGENFRAVTLPVDQSNSLATSIVAGDLIDIVYTFSMPKIGSRISTVLMQNVPVIATGSYSVIEHEIGERGGRPKKYNTLTLRVSATDGLRLTYARQTGKVDIILRRSSDSTVLDFKPLAGIEDLLSASDKMVVQQKMQALQDQQVDKDVLKQQLKDLFEQQRQQKTQR